MLRPSPGKGAAGTGLSPAALASLVVLSTAIFLLYGGLLWRAAPDSSHVGRFLVSYLAVPPAAAALLLLARRWSATHLLTATGVVWGAKLVVTSALYLGLARGTAHIPVAAPPPTAAPAPLAAAVEYKPAQAAFEQGAIRGLVHRGGVPLAGAVVLLERPAPGLAAGPPTGAVTLAITGSHYGEPAILLPAGAELLVSNADSRLHTLHLYDGGRAVLNMPVPAAAAPRPVPALEPGIYEARCDTHAGERAAVVVVDHPYAMTTGAAGELAFAGVPEGPVTVLVVTGSAAVRRVRARVEPGLTTSLNIDLSTPEDPEERL